NRRAQPDRSRYLVHSKANESFQFVGFRQQASRSRNQQSSLIRQADGSGRAMQERRSIVFFERDQALGDGSRRKAEFPPGRRQAAFLNDAQEQDQVIENHH